MLKLEFDSGEDSGKSLWNVFCARIRIASIESDLPSDFVRLQAVKEFKKVRHLLQYMRIKDFNEWLKIPSHYNFDDFSAPIARRLF